MKKLLYSAFALAGLVAVSCTKEAEAPVAAETEGDLSYVTYTIEGTIGGEETRTAYADFQKFSWLAGDKISVLTYNETDSYYRIAEFTAQEAGVTTTFVGDVEEGYVPSFMATYPENAAFINGEVAFYIPGAIFMDDTSGDYYSAPSDNPLQNLALVGTVNEEGTAYAFKTAMGALKVSFTDLPAEARFLRIYDPVEKIAGYFYIDENGLLTNESAIPGTYTYTDDEGAEHTGNYSSHNLWYHFTPASDGTATLYIPLPVGKLSAGTTFYIENENEDVIFFQKATQKDIVIERNKVTELTPLKTAHEWVSLGTGRFLDNYIWNQLSFTSGQFVDVEIFRDSADPTAFRVASPYGAAASAFKYSVPRGLTPVGPEDLYLTVSSEGSVSFQTPHNTGLYHPSYTNNLRKRIETQVIDPASGYLGDYEASHNAVIKFQSTGVPGQVQLAPIYWWLSNASTGNGYWSGGAGTYLQNNLVRIIFPGATDETYDLDASVSFTEIADDDPVHPVAMVSTYLGIDLAGAKLVIAATPEAAKAAIASGTGVTEITSSGEYEVALPENAPTGEYRVYLKALAVDGLAPSAGMFYSSEPFKYYSASQDRQVPLSAILGTWTDTEVEMFFNPTLYDEDDTNDDDDAYAWQDGAYTVSFTFAESDDEELGNVMLVDFEETGVGFCGVDTPIYGRFDSAHGLLTFDAAQPIYSFEQDGTNYGIVFEDYMNDAHDAVPLTFEISEDLNSLSLNYEYFTYSYWNLDTDAFAGYSNIIMYGPVPKKATTSSAPASVVRGNVRQDKAVRVKPAQEKLPQVFAKRK